jgi:hypothetical protein
MFWIYQRRKPNSKNKSCEVDVLDSVTCLNWTPIFVGSWSCVTPRVNTKRTRV